MALNFMVLSTAIQFASYFEYELFFEKTATILAYLKQLKAIISVRFRKEVGFHELLIVRSGTEREAPRNTVIQVPKRINLMM